MEPIRTTTAHGVRADGRLTAIIVRALMWGSFAFLSFWGGTIVGALINAVFERATTAGFSIALAGRLVPLAVAAFRFSKAMKATSPSRRNEGIAIALTMVAVVGVLWFISVLQHLQHR